MFAFIMLVLLAVVFLAAVSYFHRRSHETPQQRKQKDAHPE
jgi:hypothetical protein